MMRAEEHLQQIREKEQRIAKRNKRMTTISTAFGLLSVLVPALLLGWYAWDVQANRGLHFGYWGDMNRVRDAVQSLDGVTRVSTGETKTFCWKSSSFVSR